MRNTLTKVTTASMIAGAALLVSACGGETANNTMTTNTMGADTYNSMGTMGDSNMMGGTMDSNMSGNMMGGSMGGNMMGSNSMMNNMMMQDMNTNAPDTNLANGM